ncbi:alpha-acetolactate decarboxylase [Echria macrotheca]|uniref:Alpha-acetolactate decarboxylase n=1 Tax=Echria macrotheca TaxID=438768 RepID=A0AAJ0F9H6_9PEZI|nr:alpha-acetolactate decarboxylase [Echria macrotheca]
MFHPPHPRISDHRRPLLSTSNPTFNLSTRNPNPNPTSPLNSPTSHRKQFPKMAANEVYQYSIISALMDGVATNGIPISRLLDHGTHGLGTFRGMQGEMIILDSEVYQMKADGTVVHISRPAETITPFATITRFEPTTSVKTALGSKADLSSLLSTHFPGTKNHFLAIRIDGSFRKINFRTAGGQITPREGMVSVCARQTEHTFENVRGTVVGFRCPGYVMGINVAGDHFHFITDDRQRGGHILAFETDGEVQVGVAVMSRFCLDLPVGDEEFDGAALGLDSKGIEAVEG